jgi:hypothetical protein
MSTVKARLEALEKRAPAQDGIEAMFVTFVAPGENEPVQCEPMAVRNGTGWRLDREPGEGIDVFRDRARQLCPRPGGRPAVLVDVLE